MTIPQPVPMGPFETEQQASAHPAVREVYEAFDRDPGPGKMAPYSERILTDACAAAGVNLGAHDQRIITWLAGWEPATCAVVAGLITRAAGRALGAGELSTVPGVELSTVLDALDFAAGELRDRVADCAECGAERCTTCGNRLARAECWDKAAETLRGQL